MRELWRAVGSFSGPPLHGARRGRRGERWRASRGRLSMERGAGAVESGGELLGAASPWSEARAPWRAVDSLSGPPLHGARRGRRGERWRASRGRLCMERGAGAVESGGELLGPASPWSEARAPWRAVESFSGPPLHGARRGRRGERWGASRGRLSMERGAGAVESGAELL